MGSRRRATSAWILVAVACAFRAAAAHFVRANITITQTPDQPALQLLELTNLNYQAVAAAVASPQKEILLTTVDVFYKGKREPERVLEIFANFAHHLAQVNRLRNTLILSYTRDTCALLLAIGISCLVDRAALQGKDLPGSHRHAAPTFQKYWHSYELSRLNYTLLVVDPDLSIVQDPFAFHDRSYDVEGLSDWNEHAEVPLPRQYLSQGCYLYRMVQHAHDSKATYIQPFWELDAHHHNSVPSGVTKHVSPCMSTGLWFTEPRATTLSFLEHMLDWMLVQHPDQWEQAAWNEVIMSHLFGVAGREPLRFRILPVDTFVNLPTYQMRQQQGLTLNAAIIHAGGVQGTDKEVQLQAAGIWNADDWDPSIGMALVAKLHSALQELNQDNQT